MSYHSLGVRTTNVTTGNACLEIINDGTSTVKLLELTITMAATTASTFGIGRPAAKGITPTSPVVLAPEDSSVPDSLVKAALAWGTGPTIPAKFFKRTSLPATVGAGRVIAFPKGISIPVGGTLIIWNLSATGVSDIDFVVSV